VSIRRLPFPLLYLGLVAQLCGLLVDAILHAADPALAGHEPLFTLGNPSHALFLGGVALACAGVALGLLRALPDRRGHPAPYRTALRSAAPAGLLLALVATTGFAAWQAGATGAAAGAHAHDQPATASGASDFAHGHGNTTAALLDSARSTQHAYTADPRLKAADLATLNGQLAAARRAGEKYRDVEVARREGYYPITDYIPGLGAHWLNTRRVFGGGDFDPTRPEIILYEPDGNDGLRLVGLSYVALKPEGDYTPPEGFAGGLDVWHFHSDFCFIAGRVAFFQPAQCAQQRGTYLRESPWTLHVWLYKESPEGVFSHENPRLP
jgi:hypothetical protein